MVILRQLNGINVLFLIYVMLDHPRKRGKVLFFKLKLFQIKEAKTIDQRRTTEFLEKN